MALLERYLDAVARHLPADKADDILAELRDDIQARLDERAAALGRGLTEEEEAGLLKPFGRPILLASRYGTPRCLVGPNLFPFYWRTLKIALAVAFAANVAVLVLLVLLGRPAGGMVERLFQFPTGTAVTIFAWVTIVFAGLELATSGAKYRDDWDPRRLPRAAAARLPRPSRLGTAFELTFDALFVLLWTAVHRSPELLSLPPAIALAPAWSDFYVPVLAVVLAAMLVKAVVLVRPDWTDFRVAGGLATTAGGTIIAALLLAAAPLVLPGEAGGDAARVAQVLDAVLRWSIAIGVLIALAQTGADLWRWFRQRKRTR